jgi:hypothetical protein
MAFIVASIFSPTSVGGPPLHNTGYFIYYTSDTPGIGGNVTVSADFDVVPSVANQNIKDSLAVALTAKHLITILAGDIQLTGGYA